MSQSLRALYGNCAKCEWRNGAIIRVLPHDSSGQQSSNLIAIKSGRQKPTNQFNIAISANDPRAAYSTNFRRASRVAQTAKRRSRNVLSAWFMSIARLLPCTKRFCYRMVGQSARIIRANAPLRFFRRSSRITALKSKQNRTVPIASRSERRPRDTARSLYVFPKLRVLARGQSRIKHPRVISDSEVMPDTKQRSNYDR